MMYITTELLKTSFEYTIKWEQQFYNARHAYINTTLMENAQNDTRFEQ